MNGKRAKLFRKLAGVDSKASGDRSYHGVSRTVRNREIKDLTGEVTSSYKTATWQLNPCARVLYQSLKKNYMATGFIGSR